MAFSEIPCSHCIVTSCCYPLYILLHLMVLLEFFKCCLYRFNLPLYHCGPRVSRASALALFQPQGRSTKFSPGSPYGYGSKWYCPRNACVRTNMVPHSQNVPTLWSFWYPSLGRGDECKSQRIHPCSFIGLIRFRVCWDNFTNTNSGLINPCLFK